MADAEIQRIGVTARWSDVVIHRGTAYLVEVPDDASGDMEAQTLQVFSQLDRRLASIGSHRGRLLQVQVYLPYPEDLPTFNRLWDAWLMPGTAPSRACVHAPLVSPSYRVELIITAAVADSERS